ncbi:MAG: hypothetical protein PWQ39_384 [Thermacetogenium sp.]|nr:hypothetical protein [Thermacetogenium sp.]
MSQTTKIEWCDSVWNPTSGCTPISPGCDNCFAKRFAYRLRGRYPDDDPFRVTLRPERLEEPLRWKKPRKVFVCSMCDLFHPEVQDEWLDRIFAVMAVTFKHIYFILTKRPERMYQYLTNPETPYRIVEEMNSIDLVDYEADCLNGKVFNTWPLSNVWFGVTTENQEQADKRIPTYEAGEHSSERCQYNRTIGECWVKSSYSFHDEQVMVKVGKKAAGRILDGRTWDEMPSQVRKETKEKSNITEERICEKCGGLGEVREYIHSVVFNTPLYRWVKCDACDGTGEITQEAGKEPCLEREE